MGALPSRELARTFDDAILPDLWRRRTQLNDDEVVSMYGLVSRALRAYHPQERQALGDAGRHTRFAVGAISLPRNVAVEIDGMFEVKA